MTGRDCTMSETIKYACRSKNEWVLREKLITGEMKKFEVLVKVVACGISAEDYIPVLTGVHVDNGCQPLGTDISGIVHRVGAEVKTLRTGDRVAGVIPLSYQQSGCAEYAVLEEYDLVYVPDGLNLVDVAACIGDCVRAYIALFYSSKVTRDDTVLVLRGALPCADICIQIAHRVGCKVLTTCASMSEKTYLEKLGTDGIIDLSSCEDVADTLYHECMKKTDNLGVDVVLDLETQMKDVACHLSTDAIISCLTIHGRWVSRNANLQLDPPDSRKLFERCACLSFLYEHAWLISKISQGKYQHILLDAMSNLKNNMIRPSSYQTVNLEALPGIIQQLGKQNVKRLVVTMK